ncbi:MAG: geranylgeranylglyceryl/heptaprenylglyceryl phosphate synthase [Chitinispirillaceae bacterium]|nr:geranylgeranylglyceryl/heptaprenylglyceryl phosphate synthase [Chitinispirillaceae bacterium]
MKQTKVFDLIREKAAARRRQYWILLDPDDFSHDNAARMAGHAQTCGGVDAVLVGGSLVHNSSFDAFVAAIKKSVSIPVILFPGDAMQLSRYADALLYLSLISGRNPVNLIGEHVKAAPIIQQIGIEPIATAYMLVESGSVTSVEFMSNTRPLPRGKPGIAAAHALAAQYMGMKLVYLEAGSGALKPVPAAMIREVKQNVEIPVIVGGGIRDAKTARQILAAGADIIVTGNMLLKPGGKEKMREIARAVKG